MDNQEIKIQKSTKFLGMNIHSSLKWLDHIKELKKRLNSGIFSIQQIRQSLYHKEIKKVYFAFFHSHLTYGTMLWASESSVYVQEIFSLQKTAIRILRYGSRERKSCRGIFKELGILTLTSIYIQQHVTYAKKFLTNLTNSSIHGHNTRGRNKLHMGIKMGDLNYTSVKLYNKLPESLRALEMKPFKRKLKLFLLEKEFYNLEEFLLD